MKRFPAYAFAVLVVASIGAFFITQHLKTSSSLIAGFARPVPPTIDPITSRMCVYPGRKSDQKVSYGRTRFSFYLPDRADTVGVSIVRAGEDNEPVRSLGWHRMLAGPNHTKTFIWDGRDGRGRVVPEATYYVKIDLQQQARTLVVSYQPIRVLTHAVTPKVISVSGPSAGGLYTIKFTPRSYRYAQLRIYSVGVRGKLTLIDEHEVTGVQNGTSVWDGRDRNGKPAPAGRYVVGVRLADSACDVGSFPASDRTSGATKHATITISDSQS